MSYSEVHEVFSYPVERSVCDPNYLNDYLHYFDKHMLLLQFASLFSPVVKACFYEENKRFAFYTTRFDHVISGLDNSSLLLFGKPQELPYALKKNISFYPVYDLIPELIALFRSDPMLESSRAVRLIESLTTVLARMNLEYLVVWNDSLFLERFLVYCCRRVGIKSICIQHGIFHDSVDCRFLDGYYADYMFVWGKSQAGLYTDPNFNKDKLRIMGYPNKLDNFHNVSNENKVCILGENIELLDHNLGLKKKHVYEVIANMLHNEKYVVVYKPHPFESAGKYMPSNIEVVSISLNDAFNKYSKFIALTSTALLEASLHGKIAIQYYDDCFGGSDFSLKGFAYTTKDMNEIPSLLSRTEVPSIIATDALFLCQNPAQSFLDMVDSL